MANMTTYRLGRTVRFQLGDIQDHLNNNCKVAGTGGAMKLPRPIMAWPHLLPQLFPAKSPLGKPTGRPTGNPLESTWLLHGFLRLFDSFTPPKQQINIQ